MSKEMEEGLSVAVRKYPTLYDKTSAHFKDKRKKSLAWDDVAMETGLESKYFTFLLFHKPLSARAFFGRFFLILKNLTCM